MASRHRTAPRRGANTVSAGRPDVGACASWRLARPPSAVVALLVVLAAASSALVPVAARADRSAAATAPVGAENLTVTNTVRDQLVAAFAAAHHLRPAEVAGTYPGSVFYGFDSATAAYWATASFDPARSDSARIADSFQDAGSNGVFSRDGDGAWQFRGAGVPLSCTEERLVPAAVLAVWGVPASSPGCSSDAVAAPAATAGRVVLGSAGFVMDGVGWGTVRPPVIFNGGDPSGKVWNIIWRAWGGSAAVGNGLNWIFRPQGGYYAQPVGIELRAYGIGSCSPGGPRAYLHLEVREPSRPGGPLGRWVSWGGQTSVCPYA